MVSLRAHLASGSRALIFSLLAFASNGAAFGDEAVVDRWLAAQAKIETWSADVIQTRTLKTFSQPLTSTGKVWFSAPNQFRWELGEPPQTIAVRQSHQLLVLYPKLRRVERYPTEAAKLGAWKDALALLEAGFPRSRAELEERFQVVSVSKDETGTTVIQLEPRAAGARKMLHQLRVGFSAEDLKLQFTQLHFADGSIIRNAFRNPVANAPVSPALFQPEIPADYKVTEPLKGTAR